MLRRPLLFLLLTAGLQAQVPGLFETLDRSILAPNQPVVEVKAFTSSRVPPLLAPTDADAWEEYIGDIRRRVLDDVFFRGEARAWREAEMRVEWLGTIPGGEGYRIKKLRYEAVPGLWIPALLYEPENLSGKVPVILNVNGHDTEIGKASDYKQARCINQAKRGMLALNVEWVGMGQLNTPGFMHYRMNQLDLAGTSGIAVHYLAMERAIDLLLAHENADPERLAVTGLSGGGWQTITISALDERVRLADPVAGYSSFLTRAQFPETDLGDSEQTPSDLAAVADYTHLTAMRAPRPTLLTFNGRDTCCFRADHALGPLLQSAKPVFSLMDVPAHVRHHVNQDAGHNYGKDNREAFYKALRDYFYAGSPDFQVEEIPVEDELKTFEELTVELPEDNLDFHQLALRLAADLPKNATGSRERLRELTRTPRYEIEAEQRGEPESRDGVTATYWRLHMGADWTVPAVELQPDGGASETVIVLADGGRTSATGDVRDHLDAGRRVIAIDPFYFGESKIETRDFLFAILVASLGERPLGIQAGQVSAVARWAHSRFGAPAGVHAVGPRTSLIALVAGSLEQSVGDVVAEESFTSLREVIERDLAVNQAPELFCFGLLAEFDIARLRELAGQ